MSSYCVVQWDRMLTMIGQTLKENGIQNVSVKGNVFVRNQAIAAFRVCSQNTVDFSVIAFTLPRFLCLLFAMFGSCFYDVFF